MSAHEVNGTCPEKNKKNNDEGKRWPQILAMFIVAIGTFTSGLIFAWSSPFSLTISQDKINYNITEEDTTLFMIFQPVGMIVGSIFFFSLSEFLGRKKSVIFLAVPQIIVWIVFIFATTKWHFCIGRLIGGIGDAVLFIAVPPYIGEISTPTVRGLFGGAPTLSTYAGQFVINVIGSFVNVRMTSYVCILLPILFVILVTILPESPYELIKRGKFEEAKRSIKWLQRMNEPEEAFQIMKSDVERQISESGSWLDLIRIDSNKRAMRAGIFLRFSQQFCGIATFASYSQPIFAKAGGNVSPQTSSMIFVGLIGLLNLCCSVTVEKFGRKRSYFYSVLSAGAVLLALAIYFFAEQYQLANLDNLTWFPLTGMLLWVLMYSAGLGLVPTLMLSELFSESIKSKALGVLVVFFGLGVFFTTNLFTLCNTYVGFYSPFLLYAIACFLSCFLTMKWVPETKGQTLEEIQQQLKKGKI